MSTTQLSDSETRLKFFDLLFGDTEGYLCIAIKNPQLDHAAFQQKFFEWPRQFMEAEEFIIRNCHSRDIYFCVNLLSKQERKKEYCLRSNLVWADLDETDPQGIPIPPPLTIQSSEGRYQGIWRVNVELDQTISESYSKRVAYAYGADKSGWDLTQLLRVPGTFNHKHSPPHKVKLITAMEVTAAPMIFEQLPAVEGDSDISFTDIPGLQNLPPVDAVLYKYGQLLREANFTSLFTVELQPEDDWSKPMWKLIHICMEAGMSDEETYVILQNASCNKYDRDNRPPTHLWRDILKARQQQDRLTIISASYKPVTMPQIVDPDFEPSEGFVSRYRQWAEAATDAVPDFHDLSAYILLSTIIANSVKLLTSYGPMVPNIWGLILGDSTLTRKSTAMRMIMDILQGINPEVILATDGSAEGLLGGLELRPNKTSMFFRDEVSGFFDSINRKDYLAGMPETFTHLYDVPTVYQRRLRKEVIRLESPIFIFFGGGVRDKVYEVATEEYVLSGFLPRFLVVSGDTDLSRLRRTGPANEVGIEQRASLVNEAANLFEHYAVESKQIIMGQEVIMPPMIAAELDNNAWEYYGTVEEKLVIAGSESTIPHLALPTFERLSRSILKMSVLTAAARQEPKNGVIEVTINDVRTAAWYGQRWGPFSIDLITNTGKGVTEKLLDRVKKTITENPGVLRASILQRHHLTKKQADEILGTLEERMVIQKQKQGRGYAYWAT